MRPLKEEANGESGHRSLPVKERLRYVACAAAVVMLIAVVAAPKLGVATSTPHEKNYDYAVSITLSADDAAKVGCKSVSGTVFVGNRAFGSRNATLVLNVDTEADPDRGFIVSFKEDIRIGALTKSALGDDGRDYSESIVVERSSSKVPHQVLFNSWPCERTSQACHVTLVVELSYPDGAFDSGEVAIGIQFVESGGGGADVADEPSIGVSLSPTAR